MAFGQTPVQKGQMARVVRGAVVSLFTFQYNPTEVSENLEVDWVFTESPGQYLPVAVFGKFGRQTQSFELFLYDRERGVRGGGGFGQNTQQQVDHLKLFVNPGPAFGQDSPQFVAPPGTKLVRGSRVWNGVVTGITVREILHDRTGRLRVARVGVDFTVTSQGFSNELGYLDSLRAGAGVNG